MTAPLRLTLLGRPGCHLCEEARAALERIAAEDGVALELREVDIESDPALLRANLERIPVIERDGIAISELEADPGALREALAHTVGPAPGAPGERTSSSTRSD